MSSMEDPALMYSLLDTVFNTGNLTPRTVKFIYYKFN